MGTRVHRCGVRTIPPPINHLIRDLRGNAGMPGSVGHSTVEVLTFCYCYLLPEVPENVRALLEAVRLRQQTDEGCQSHRVVLFTLHSEVVRDESMEVVSQLKHIGWRVLEEPLHGPRNVSGTHGGGGRGREPCRWPRRPRRPLCSYSPQDPRPCAGKVPGTSRDVLGASRGETARSSPDLPTRLLLFTLGVLRHFLALDLGLYPPPHTREGRVSTRFGSGAPTRRRRLTSIKNSCSRNDLLTPLLGWGIGQCGW